MTAPRPSMADAAGGRVSVVMPAYNAADTLEGSMRSVLEQTHADVELLVVDDHSRDASWDIVQRIAASDRRVTAIRQPRNAGVAMARNAGIEAASGAFLAFLDSDDQWHPRKTEVQLACMRDSGMRLSYAAYERVDGQGRTLSTVLPPAEVTYRDMLRSNRIGNLTGMYDRALGDASFRRVGHEDYVFWLEMVRRAGVAGCAGRPAPLARYLVRPDSLSSGKLKAARWQWHIYRDVEGLGLAASTRYFLDYAANALSKRC